MRPSSISFDSATRATSRRTGLYPDRTTASGVSSTITSMPVACSKARILRPSRPMIRPFISSEGSCTTETVNCAVSSAAIRCTAMATSFFASRSAVRWPSSLISRTRFAASARALSSISATSWSRASFAVSPATVSRRASASARTPEAFSRSSATPCSRDLRTVARSSSDSERRSIRSDLRSMASVRCASRCSPRSTSSRRRLSSVSQVSLRRNACSLACSSAARRRLSASSLALVRISDASSRPACFSLSWRARSRCLPRMYPKTAATTAPTARDKPSGSMYFLQDRTGVRSMSRQGKRDRRD